MLRAKLSHLEILNPNKFNPVLNITARGLTTAGIAQSNGVKDISGNGNNGTAVGGVEVVNDSEMGECFSFDKTTDSYLYFSSNTRLFSNFESVTISFKIKPASLTNRVIVMMTNPSGTMPLVVIEIDNYIVHAVLRQSWSGFSGGACDSVTVIEVDKEYVVTLTGDMINKQVKLYINGNLEKTSDDLSVSEKFSSVYPTFYIGKHATVSGYAFDGLISEVKIFPYALNSNEVKELYRMSQNPSGIVPSTELMSTEALDYDSKYWEPRITDSVDIERFFDINSDTANRIRTLQIGLDNSDRRFDRYMADGRSLLNNIMTLYYDTEKTAMAPKGEILHLSAVGLTTEGIKQDNGIPDLSGNGNNGRAYNGVSVVTDDELGECFQFGYGCVDGNISFGKNVSIAVTFKRTGACQSYAEIFMTNKSEYAYLTIKLTNNGFYVNIFPKYADIRNQIILPYPELDVLQTLIVSVDFENKKTTVLHNGQFYRKNITAISSSWLEEYTSYRIGGHNSTQYSIHAKIGDFKLFPRTLTENEMHDLYLSSIPDNNPVKRSFTGSIQSIDSYGSEVRLTLRELGYEYLEQNYPDAQIAYDHYSDSGINESWNCIPIHFGTVKGIPLSWVNSFYSEYMIGSGPILRVTRIYIDNDRSLPESDTSEVDGKDNGVLYKLVNNVGTETGYKPSSSDPDTEIIHVRIFRGTGYDADGQKEIVTDSYRPETADSSRWTNGSTSGKYNHISQWGGFAYIQLFKIKDGYEVPAYPYNHDGSIGQVYVDIEGIVPVTKSGNTYTYGNTMVRNPAEIIKMMFCNPQLTNEGPCAIGFGYSESDVDFSKAIADCETLGLKIDGSFSQTGQFSEALKKILYHCRGYIIEEDSKIKLVVDMPPERVSASFDETGEYGYDCNLETWAEPNLDEHFNRARLSYAWNYKNSKFDKKPDPNHESPDYDSANPTATSVYDEWLYDEDSYRTLKKWNTMEIELDMVHDTMTAHKLASYYLRKSIYQKIKGTISVDPESAVNLDAGNLIKIRSEQFGWYMTYYDTNGSETVDTEDGKMFQITSVRKGQELTEIDFVEYNSEIFLLDSVGTMTAKNNESEVRKKLAPQKPISVGVSEKTPIKSNNGTYLCAVDVVVTYESGTPVSTVIQMGDAGTGDTAPSSTGVIWNDVAMISENRTTITGLTPGHWYYFKVFSINSNGSSVPVISNAVHVQGDSTAPEVPTLTIDSITGRSVTVKVVLNNAPDDFAGFAVRRGNTVLEKVPCGRIASESSGTVTYRAEINYVNVCELYDTDYSFSASAYDMWGNESNACTAVTAHTEEAIDLTDIESSIEALEDDMEDTNTRITGYASDNVLSIGEKAELAKDWLSIKNDRYQKIKTEAENHGMNLAVSSYKTDYDNFVTAYNALLDWVDGSSSNIALVPTPPDTLQESSFANVCSTTAQKFADYQSCEIKLLSDIDKDNKNRATAIYAECNTPADVASKIVIIPEVVVFDGMRLCVKFLNGNSTVQTITLNIKRDESDVSGLIDGGQLYTEKGIAVPVITINAGEMITFVLVERKIIDYSSGTPVTTLIKVWEFADSALLGMGQNGTVQNETYSLGMVNGGHIIAHTVDTQQLKAQSVTTDILKAGAVTTDKITSEQIIGRDFRTDTDVGIRDSLTGLYNGGVMFDGNGIKGYDQYGQTVSIGTNGTITALRGEIGGWIIGDDSLESTGMRDMDSYDPQTSTPVKTIIIKSNGMIYTSDFVSGYSGWRIDSEGNAEFNSAIIRGSIKSAVFEYDKVSAVGGKMLVKEASIIIDNPDHITTSTKIHVLNPESFNAGDCFLVKYDASNLFYGVISAVDKTTSSNTYGDITYSIPSNAGTFFRTITVDGETVPVLDGLSIVNYGQPSAGGLMIDGNNTHIDIFRNKTTNNQHTFSGDAIQLEHLARFGNMNGIGGITTDVYGLYIGDANGFIRYDPDGGLVIKNDITSGGFLKSENFSWDDSGTTRYDIVSNSDVATGNAYTKSGMLINLNTGIIVGQKYRFDSNGNLYTLGIANFENDGVTDDILGFKYTTLTSRGNINVYDTGTYQSSGVTSDPWVSDSKASITTTSMYLNSGTDGYDTAQTLRIRTRWMNYYLNDPFAWSLDWNFAKVYSTGKKSYKGSGDLITSSNFDDGFHFNPMIMMDNLVVTNHSFNPTIYVNSSLSPYSDATGGFNGRYSFLGGNGQFGNRWDSVNAKKSSFTGTMTLHGDGDNFREGIRLRNYNGWSGILFGGNDLTGTDFGYGFSTEGRSDGYFNIVGDGGSSSNSWWFGNNNGTLMISKGSTRDTTSSAYIRHDSSDGWNIKGNIEFLNNIVSQQITSSEIHLDNSGASSGTKGVCVLYLGNNKAVSESGNAKGQIWMYNNGQYGLITRLKDSTTSKDRVVQLDTADLCASSTDVFDYTLPASSGTIALTSSDITGSSASCRGNAATATKATQDGSGNTITSTYATIAKTYDDTTNTSYRGMCGKDGAINAWVRTTKQGIIPYQSGAAGSGHCGLGTSSWYFSYAYIDNIYGKLNGNCTGSSGSCTGNAATATTATNTNNAKLTHTVGNTEYPLVFGSSFVITDAQQALRIGTPSATANQCPLRVKAYCAAANTQGEAYLVLGNALAKASANNARGGLTMYGTGTSYLHIRAGDVTANRTITLVGGTVDVTLTLPSSGGTLALTSDITATKIGYSEISSITSSGTASSGSAGWFKIGNTLVNWGMIEYTNGGNFNPNNSTITFTKAYATNFKPSVMLTRTRHTNGDGYVCGIRQDSVSNTSFIIKVDSFSGGVGQGNKQQVYWIAIGKG